MVRAGKGNYEKVMLCMDASAMLRLFDRLRQGGEGQDRRGGFAGGGDGIPGYPV